MAALVTVPEMSYLGETKVSPRSCLWEWPKGDAFGNHWIGERIRIEQMYSSSSLQYLSDKQ